MRPMAIVGDAYSRMVFWLKVLLPLAALAILSTLFLVSETLDPNKAIPYAEVDVEKILREQGVTRPSFGGVTGSGATVTLGADSVRPMAGEGLRLRGDALNVRIEMPDGAVMTIDSPVGEIDTTGRVASLDGGAVVESSLGYTVKTEALTSSFDKVDATTKGPVSVIAPGTTIDAGRMSLSLREDGEGHVLVFNEGVRLVYNPRAIKERP